ncbi:class I SAM-dependent methyltransferase [Rhodoplanes sp. Z2-YC6860]|uniref:class I SAM-dependent methyltransferase n=1 Tax=Rhodoplanes sp. Z2-YC6860 TaxID=674703 RepID=UPI00078E7A2A|nr:methyltransferase domain-containing protein [Rhodoplanes sp. Z2-YC6860]AMN44820.1 methyltransferase [Rhodoplanes sp. Z2-YC6860]
MNRLCRFVCSGAVALVTLAAAPLPSFAQDYAAIIAAPDRSDADRQTDQRRDPVKLLNFTGVKTGMSVLDMGAGGGYSTELMARAVGPGGKVYGQDFEKSARATERFEARMKTPVMKNVTAVDRKFDDPLPEGVGNLDLITFFFFYHDTTYMTVDRAAMNKKLFAALKPGAFLVIADHSAKPGTGTSVGKTLHRIDEATLKSEVEAAGFKLVGEGDFFRHPEDTREEKIFGSKTPVDEFVLKFQKPN